MGNIETCCGEKDMDEQVFEDHPLIGAETMVELNSDKNENDCPMDKTNLSSFQVHDASEVVQVQMSNSKIIVESEDDSAKSKRSEGVNSEENKESPSKTWADREDDSSSEITENDN